MPLNRIIGEYYDIHGDFFLCGQDEYDLCDLPEEKVEYYIEMFRVEEK